MPTHEKQFSSYMVLMDLQEIIKLWCWFGDFSSRVIS